MNKRGALAISQIVILMFGIVAIGWAVGSEVGEVSGEEIDYSKYKVEYPNGDIFTVVKNKNGVLVWGGENKWGLKIDLPAGFEKENSRTLSAARYAAYEKNEADKMSEFEKRYDEYKKTQSSINTPVGGLTTTLIDDKGGFKFTLNRGKVFTSTGKLSFADVKKQHSTLTDLGDKFNYYEDATGSIVATDGTTTYYIGKKRSESTGDILKKGAGKFEWQKYGTIKESGFVSTESKSNPTTPNEKRKELLENKNKGLTPPKETKLKGEGDLGMLGSGLMTAAGWGFGAYTASRMFLPLIDRSSAFNQAVSLGIGGGFLVGKASGSIATFLGGSLTSGEMIGIGIGSGLLIAALTYKKQDQKTITYTCSVWEAPLGDKPACEDCNKQGEGIPCSEYQCKAYGQACELLNGGTDEEKCAWVNRNDVTFPTISPWEDALLGDYDYELQNTGISPPDRGAIIELRGSSSGCVKPFTPLSFGITTDEPSKCKSDIVRKESFEDMDYFFSGSMFRYNHSMTMSLPGASALKSENVTIKNDGNYEVFVRCSDANDNFNVANFVFKFCVEKGPDTTPPLIVDTNFLNGFPIAFNQTSLDLEVYVNEPADCKWSHDDKDYDNMEEEMTCVDSIFEMNAKMLYRCSTTLTGLKDLEENKFYFRCEDKSTVGPNVNKESYLFTVIGTQPLIIDSIAPNGTVKDATDSVKVTLEAKTSAGYKDGKSICYYSETGEENSYVMFFETDSHYHTQDLYLIEGDYDYFIRCVDLGGNADTMNTSFRVESDGETPLIARAYHEESYLKIVTDEKAECVYDTVDCSYAFEDGTKLVAVDETSHYVEWSTLVNYYIKCRDIYENRPSPDTCNIIVRPFEMDE